MRYRLTKGTGLVRGKNRIYSNLWNVEMKPVLVGNEVAITAEMGTKVCCVPNARMIISEWIRMIAQSVPAALDSWYLESLALGF
mmetsp:Transcript_28156/g.39319  ORF Transcript_28156/g.39319 Transcript_28156/m.39319 type:complete len:84 (+) Transcript_28156:156-407(+)